MAKTRKVVAMTVLVTVPREMTPAEARREVRTLISEQCFYAADEGDVKVKGVRAAKVK